MPICDLFERAGPQVSLAAPRSVEAAARTVWLYTRANPSLTMRAITDDFPADPFPITTSLHPTADADMMERHVTALQTRLSHCGWQSSAFEGLYFSHNLLFALTTTDSMTTLVISVFRAT